MKLLALDGNSILNRAFYGIRNLSTAAGLPTNAVFGFMNILHKHMTAIGPTHLACAFDTRKPTFRHEAYAGYKATRKGMPEELALQLPYAKEAARKYHMFSTNANQKKILIYQDGTYTDSQKAIERAMIQEIHSLKDSQRRETMKYLEIASPFKTLAEPNYIAFRNGVYDLTSERLLPFDPEIRIPCMIPWDYNPNAYDELCDNFLNQITCNDPEIRKTLEESTGYSFYRSCDLNAAFFLL